MIRPANMGAPWKPGDSLVMWFSPLRGVPWPTELQLKQDGPLYATTTKREVLVESDGGRPRIVIGHSPTRGRTGPLLYRAGTGPGNTHTAYPTHITLNKRFQNEVSKTTGFVLHPLRLSATGFILDPNSFRLEIPLVR